MALMTALPLSGPFTRDDLERMPDDGHRYELIDGVLLVTPAPSLNHQSVVGQLHIALTAACPPDLKVLLAPFDVVLGDDTVVQPDLIVARRTDLTRRDLPVPPLLAIEVGSPSTRLFDQTLKRARYEEAGCLSYWIVDPDELSLVAWRLVEARYVEIARIAADEIFQAEQPFPITITPSALLD